MVLVNTPDGVSDANTPDARRTRSSAFADAKVQTRDEFKANFIKPIKKILNLLYALLALSVIVSLVGIINTLVLTVYERTRELGMLRAVGMTRRQVRMMIRYESIVTALMGAALGMVVGVFLAALVTQALSSQGIVFAVPWLQLVYFVIGGDPRRHPGRRDPGPPGRSPERARGAAVRVDTLPSGACIGSGRATPATAERGGVLPPLLRLRRGDGAARRDRGATPAGPRPDHG